VPVTAILRNLSELSVPELSQEFPTVRREEIAEFLDFIAPAPRNARKMSKRVLLDENLPQKLRLLLTGRTAITVAYQGWAGMSNGALTAAAEQAGFDVMITADQGLNYQQSLKGCALAVVFLSTNRNSLVIENGLRILQAIYAAQPGGFAFVVRGF
jgi:hypothetical protein